MLYFPLFFLKRVGSKYYTNEIHKVYTLRQYNTIYKKIISSVCNSFKSGCRTCKTKGFWHCIR
jgi:hypothetical protein